MMIFLLPVIRSPTEWTYGKLPSLTVKMVASPAEPARNVPSSGQRRSAAAAFADDHANDVEQRGAEA